MIDSKTKWVLDGYNMAKVLRCTAERGSPEARHTCGDYEDIATAHGDNWKENAQLIAAAPELLAALKMCLSGGYKYKTVELMAQFAIQKAEGKYNVN